MRRTLLVGAAGVVVAIGLFLGWYRLRYSMSPAQAFDVAGPVSGPRVLIATQGSDFKQSVVAGVVDHLKGRAALSVIDVSALSETNDGDWDAIVVMHTWEMRKPPAAVKTFVDGVKGREKLIVLTTSGAGDFRLEGVDAISSASRVEDVPARVAEISARIDAVLSAHAKKSLAAQ
jgi:hypothetical protein